MILLLFGTARVQALTDNEECEYGQIEDGSCQKNIEKNIEESDESHVHKSVFSETHDCNMKEVLNDGDNDGSHGSCHQREQVEDDQSELSMLEEQNKKDDDGDSYEFNKETPTECDGKYLEEEVKVAEEAESNDGASVTEEIQSSEEPIHDEVSDSSKKEVENTEEGNTSDQDLEMGNVPLREILLKLKVGHIRLFDVCKRFV